jgi:geranylgeranyl reductase family protein
MQQGIRNTSVWKAKQMERFDVVVVGAGTAGSMVAKTAAKAGLNVCLLDSKPRSDIGEKVCGDAVGKHHFDELGLSYPGGEELRAKIEGIRIYSPDMQTTFTVKSGTYGFILNRRMFGQRLLDDAIDAGATFHDSTIATKPETKKGFITGVTTKDTKTHSTAQLHARVVVDGSGFTAILRKCLPTEMGIDLQVKNEDVEACYREIRQLKSDGFDQKYCEIYLDQTQTPGGYYWIFPEGEKRINVGLGVSMVKGFPNPKNQFYTQVLPHSKVKDSTLLKGGSWCVPTRRPLDCMTGNGIVVIGDSACQVNPIHGGGIGPSMMGGNLAGKTIVKAIEEDDVSRKGLWQYNVDYMKSYGAKQAGLDIFRLFLLKSVGNEEINYGMKYKLITEDDLLRVSEGQNLKLRISDKTRRAFYGLGKVPMLRRLAYAANTLKKMKTHYMEYPSSPDGFDNWLKQTQILMDEAKLRLSRSKT